MNDPKKCVHSGAVEVRGKHVHCLECDGVILWIRAEQLVKSIQFKEKKP